MSDLYDTDIVTWSERQATLLRSLAAGERTNETPDWTNIIEEIEAVGRSELRSVESLLEQVAQHRLKLLGWPRSLSVEHWTHEVASLSAQGRRRYERSMKQRIDLPAIYAGVLRDICKLTVDGQPPAPLPEECPWTLEELLGLPEP